VWCIWRVLFIHDWRQWVASAKSILWVWRSSSNRRWQVYLQDQVPSKGFVVAGCQWKQHKQTSVFKAGLAVNKEVYISKCLPVLHKFIQKHHKSCLGLIWRLHTTQRYVGSIRRTHRKKIQENYTDTADWRILGEKEVLYSNNYRPKDIKSLMAVLDQKIAEVYWNYGNSQSHERGASKGPQTGCNFFLQVICV
jgi:hypothetical protein